MSNLKRVNANFSGEAYEILQTLAKQKGKTISEILRDAVALEKWIEDTKVEGGRILVERNGKISEVVIR